MPRPLPVIARECERSLARSRERRLAQLERRSNRYLWLCTIVAILSATAIILVLALRT